MVAVFAISTRRPDWIVSLDHASGLDYSAELWNKRLPMFQRRLILLKTLMPQ